MFSLLGERAPYLVCTLFGGGTICPAETNLLFVCTMWYLLYLLFVLLSLQKVIDGIGWE